MPAAEKMCLTLEFCSNRALGSDDVCSPASRLSQIAGWTWCCEITSVIDRSTQCWFLSVVRRVPHRQPTAADTTCCRPPRRRVRRRQTLYDGAGPRRHLKTIVASLMGSRWNWRNTGVMW